MKVSTYKRQQRHLRARRKYWDSVYTQNGLRRVPLPLVECYTEEGEIVPLPPFEWNKETSLLDLLPRDYKPVGVDIHNWQAIVERFGAQKEAEAK